MRLAERESFVDFDAVPQQQRPKLVFKRMFAAVFGLILDVVDGRFHIRLTDAESAVSILPGEAAFGQSLFVDPLGLKRLERLNGFRQRHGRRQRKHNVGVVVRAADGVHWYLVIAADPAQVVPQTGLKVL